MTTSPSEFTISEELKKWIGREMQLGTALIEAGAIKNFADAFKDPNPIYRDRGVRQGYPLRRHYRSSHFFPLPQGGRVRQVPDRASALEERGETERRERVRVLPAPYIPGT